MTKESLSVRFGNGNFFEDSFEDVNRVNMQDEFREFHLCKTKTVKPNDTRPSDRYEALRQRFLKLLGQNKMIWTPSNPEHDRDVEVSRIYRRDQEEYIAFMRIKPQGFRAERSVQKKLDMVFHVLTGKVTFSVKKRARNMSTGHHITVQAGSNYSIRCGNEDEPAYLIFYIKNKQP